MLTGEKNLEDGYHYWCRFFHTVENILSSVVQVRLQNKIMLLLHASLLSIKSCRKFGYFNFWFVRAQCRSHTETKLRVQYINFHDQTENQEKQVVDGAFMT